MKTFAINGAGRIGRLAFRIWFEKHRDRLDLKLINTSGSMDLEGWVQLLKYDTAYGVFPEKISFKQLRGRKEISNEQPELGFIKVADRKIFVTAQKDPALLPWAKYEVDLVLESTGVFTKAVDLEKHLQAGAKKVLLSAPGKGEGFMNCVIGVNEADRSKQIFSNASCTTNCIAPVTKILKETVGIEKAMLNTIHSYTNDQNLQDNSHKKDLRRARAAAYNIVPTSTGAAKAVTQILPSLKDKFDGVSIRVPTLTVSLADITVVTKRPTSVEKLREIFTQAAHGDYKKIVAVTDEPLVSSDFIGCEYSAVVDLNLIQVVDGNLVKIIAWYDNEWGYTCRLMEQLLKI